MGASSSFKNRVWTRRPAWHFQHADLVRSPFQPSVFPFGVPHVKLKVVIARVERVAMVDLGGSFTAMRIYEQ